MMLQRTVVCCLVLFNIRCLLVGGVTITPSIDYTVPVSYAKNITYHCHGGSGESVFPEVCISSDSCTQLQDPGMIRGLEEYGIYIELRRENESMITVTLRAREFSRFLMIGCVLRNVDGTGKPRRSIFTYDPPYDVTVDALPGNRIQVSWSCPINGYRPSYNVTVTGLISGATAVQSNNNCSTIFDLSGYVCDEFNISVATMDVEDGINSMVSITAKLPLAPDVSPIEGNFTVQREDNAIIISFEPASVCNPDYPVEHYSLYLMSSNTTTIISANSCSRERCHVTITTEVESEEFNFTIEACNNITCQSTDTLSGKIDLQESPNFLIWLLWLVIALIVGVSAVVAVICRIKRVKQSKVTLDEGVSGNAPPTAHGPETSESLGHPTPAQDNDLGEMITNSNTPPRSNNPRLTYPRQRPSGVTHRSTDLEAYDVQPTPCVESSAPPIPATALAGDSQLEVGSDGYMPEVVREPVQETTSLGENSVHFYSTNNSSKLVVRAYVEESCV